MSLDDGERGPLGFDSADQRQPPESGDRPSQRKPEQRKAGGARFGWIAGVVGFLILVYILLNTLRTEGTGSAGLPAGRSLPQFAMPLVASDLDGDANVATRSSQGGGAGARPACEIRDPRVLNSCQLVKRGPLVLAFMTSTGECERELDVLQRVAQSPTAHGVGFAAVAIRGDREALRTKVRNGRWRLPIGFDRDGAVANLSGVSVCPTITFAYPGGVVRRTTVGTLGEAELTAQVRELAAASRQRGWSSR